MLAGAVEQAAIGRVRNRLGLHGGVQYHRLKAAALDHAGTAGGFDAVGQQPFAARLANALAPAHEAGRVAGQLVAEVALAA